MDRPLSLLDALQDFLYEEIPYLLFYRAGKFHIVHEAGTYTGVTLEEAVQDLLNRYEEDDDDDPNGGDGGQFVGDPDPGPIEYPPLRVVYGGKA